jgi:hypothetical protein
MYSSRSLFASFCFILLTNQVNSNESHEGFWKKRNGDLRLQGVGQSGDVSGTCFQCVAIQIHTQSINANIVCCAEE